MAVAAYASLVSLTHVLDNLHYRARFHIPRVDMKQIETLQENVHFLLEFVELHSERKSPETDGVWRRIAEAAFEAEDTINYYVVHLLHLRSQGETTEACFSAFCAEMETLISKADSIKEKLVTIQVEGLDVQDGNRPSAFAPAAAGSSLASSSGKRVVVGLDEHVVRIMDVLTQRDESNLQVFPITGMGGIGKTTLAKSVFDHPYIVDYFDMRIWLTISQGYSIQEILLGLVDGEGNRVTRESFVESGERLYQKLFGRRYLIVMDDVWTIQAWDELKRFFPNNGNGSCVILTTRMSNVAACLGSHNPYPLPFLSEDKSWDLFCQTTFGQIGCPYAELEEIGKNIVQSCRGLPLEIVVIGGLLGKSSMTREYWEFVAKNISSLANLGENEHCFRILSLSYKSLPIYLKPCFLYMGDFREDALIFASVLMEHWIGNGFIKSVRNKSLEETADKYLKDLIDRNLIFTRSGTEFYCTHDLLRDLCLKEADNERFNRSPKLQKVALHKDTKRYCFLCSVSISDEEGIHFPKLVHLFPSSSQVSPLVCGPCRMMYSHIRRPRFVRTMDDLLPINHKIEIMHPTELRFASIAFLYTSNCKFLSPSTLHMLWNLQSLRFHNQFSRLIVLPAEIWEMPQIRCIDVTCGVVLPDPAAAHIEGEDFLVLNSFWFLSKVINFKCTEQMLERIPNLRTLVIEYKEDGSKSGMERLDYSLSNLSQLQKLESLSVYDALEKMTFPNSLKHLFLWRCQMTWEGMSIVGSLPSLETLRVCAGIEGSEWNPVEGEFLRLKELSIYYTNLVCWRADENHFPILEMLKLEGLKLLKEIPSSIGDIPTLQLIDLDGCNDLAVDSAKQIWEEQRSMENNSFELYVDDEVWRPDEVCDNDSDS